MFLSVWRIFTEQHQHPNNWKAWEISIHFFSNFLSVKIPPKGIYYYYHIAIAISSIFWFKRSCDTQFFVGSLIHTAKLLGLSTYRWHLRNGVRLRQKLVSIHLIDDLFQFQHIIGPHWNATKSFSVALHFIAIWAKTTKKTVDFSMSSTN